MTLAPQTVRCMYCGRDLFPCGKHWMDRDGITVCLKLDAVRVLDPEPDYFFHEPEWS